MQRVMNVPVGWEEGSPWPSRACCSLDGDWTEADLSQAGSVRGAHFLPGEDAAAPAPCSLARGLSLWRGSVDLAEQPASTGRLLTSHLAGGLAGPALSKESPGRRSPPAGVPGTSHPSPFHLAVLAGQLLRGAGPSLRILFVGRGRRCCQRSGV